MLTARQVADMIGPESLGCECSTCGYMRRVKELVCEPVTAMEEDKSFPDEDVFGSPWMAVLMLAAGRLHAQGMPLTEMAQAVMYGVNEAENDNPLLCGDVSVEGMH